MRVFLSYHTADEAQAIALKVAIEARDDTSRVFFAPHNMRPGAFWLARLGEEITEADAFLLLLSSNGVGAWQKLEYYEALDRRTRDSSFSVVPVVTAPSVPGLPFLRQLHWISSATPHADPQLSAIIDALKGQPLADIGDPWRHVNPYRGLLALREEDAAYFFGREGKVIEILRSIESRPAKIITLVGNSGVGKSSLVQAGVVGSLKRQNWPIGGPDKEIWPIFMKTSRSWAYLNASLDFHGSESP
jgi:hypothetical protein